jgi:hypothetical protein
MVDALNEWLSVRASVNWSEFICVQGNVIGSRDGHRHYIETVVRPRDPIKADRLNLALDQVRIDAHHREELNFERLCAWQRILFEDSEISFRLTRAFAKSGREVYELDESTWAQFENCLGDANMNSTSVLARVTRAYLDVLFFHPFADGNGRAATLVLDFLLSKENIVLSEVRPLFMVSRSPDSAGTVAFVRLLEVLVTSTLNNSPCKYDGKLC